MVDHEKILQHILICDKCFSRIAEIIMAESGRRGGESTSVAKARAARINGRKGGRPRKVESNG